MFMVAFSTASNMETYSLVRPQAIDIAFNIFLPSLKILVGPFGEQMSPTPVICARMTDGLPDRTNSCTISSSFGRSRRMNVGSSSIVRVDPGDGWTVTCDSRVRIDSGDCRTGPLYLSP